MRTSSAQLTFCSFFILCLAAALPFESSAQSDSRVPTEVVLSISHFNFDCRKDTLMGRMIDAQGFLPTRINWGRDDERGSRNCTPDRKNKDSSTVFFFPDWANLSGSVTVRPINNDSLPDILVFINGTVPGSSPARDTSMGIVVFGQKQLAKVARIDIGQSGKLKSHPIFSLRLTEGEELVDKGKRDLSGRTSYVFVSPTLQLDEDTTRSSPAVAGVEEPWVRVYPNPAIFSTNVEARRIPAGDYKVLVVAVNGQTEVEENVTVGESGEIFRSINLARLASGYYLVQIHSSTALIASYPVLLLH